MKPLSFPRVLALTGLLLACIIPARAQDSLPRQSVPTYDPKISYEIRMMNKDIIICNILYISDDYRFMEILQPDLRIRALNVEYIANIRQLRRSEWNGREERKRQKRERRQKTRQQNPGLPWTYLKHYAPPADTTSETASNQLRP